MKTRPRELDWLIYALLAIAASLPIQVMLRFGDPPWELASIAAKLAPLNWAVIALAVAQAWILHEASPLVWLGAPLFIVTTAWNNWLVASMSTSAWDRGSWLATLAVLAIHGLALCPNARSVLLQPGLRWWKTPPRKKLAADAVIFPTQGGELSAVTVDISETGAFIASPRSVLALPGRSKPPREMAVGDYCSIRVRMKKGVTFSCTATVVRHACPKGSYPGGYGLSFVSLTSQEKRNLASVLRHTEDPCLAS